MAVGFYDNALEAFADGSIDIASLGLQAHLVGNSYTPNYAVHTNVTDLTDVIAGPVSLSVSSYTDGVVSASDTLFTSVSGGQIIYVILSVVTSGELIAAYSCLYNPSGGDISVGWNAGIVFTITD